MNEWNEQDWQRFEDALRAREPWELADELGMPPPDPGPLRELAIRLDAERTAAQALLDPLLTSSAAFDAAGVDRDPAFRTPAAVAALTAAAETLLERQPQFSLALSTAAEAIAIDLADARELRTMSLLGLARLERGRAMFIIGRHREAEEELRRADVAFEMDPHSTAWETARVSLVRANICREVHRFDEAIVQTRSAARVFQTFGDTTRLLAARMVEGGVLFMQRDFRSAAGVLDTLAAEARRAGDRLHLGLALQTSGNCYIELGDHGRAGEYFSEALAIWDSLGLQVERVRTNWSLGVLLKARGDLDGAIDRIDAARRSFESLGVVNDAAIARLELAEVLLLADRPAQVPDLLRNVVVTFTSEGVMHNAKLALAYLREAVEAGAVEPRIIRNVRDYLEELPTRPNSVFLPLR